MASPKTLYYAKRAEFLVKSLKSRHFDAVYCATKEEALEAVRQEFADDTAMLVKASNAMGFNWLVDGLSK